VRSRCTELKLTALPEKELKRALEAQFPDAEPEAIDSAMARSGGFLGQAQQLLKDGGALAPQTESFAAAITEKNVLLLTQTLAPMEKWKRDQLLPVLQQWDRLVTEALMSRAGMAAVSGVARRLGEARNPRELSAMQESIAKAIEYTQSNVSTGAVCGWLAWELR
jgi:hypothetical protein